MIFAILDCFSKRSSHRLFRELHVIFLIFSVIIVAPTLLAKDVLPRPTYENTFYLLFNDGYRGSPEGTTPYDEGWPAGGLTLEYQLLKLKDFLSRVGPDGPYLRIGIAESIRPFDIVDPDNDWEYLGLTGLNGSANVRDEDGLEQVRGGEDPYFNAVIVKSWALLDIPAILFIHSLTRQNWQELSDSLAVPGNLVAFIEMQPDAVQRYDDGKICIADNGDNHHTPSDFVEDIDFNGNPDLGTEVSLSRLIPSDLRESYMKRNMQAAMDHVLEINRIYPDRIVAVSCDPEFDINSVRCEQNECQFYADFSEPALSEWRQWLTHTGIYGPGGTYEGQGADPWFSDIEEFNQVTGSSFMLWEDVDPRHETAGDTLWAMYLDGGDMDGEWSPGNPPGSGRKQGWCEVMVEHRCDDAVNWLMEVAQNDGWTSDRFFTHQIPGGFTDEALNENDVPYWGYEHRLATLAATDVENGRPGITGFRETTLNLDLMDVLHDELSPDGAWSNLEFNPIRSFGYFPQYDDDYDLWIDAIAAHWERGAHIISPFRWWVPPEQPTSWANIRPDYHPEADLSIDFEARLAATHDFVFNPAHRFRPWSPGGGSLEDDIDFLPPSPTIAGFEFDSTGTRISIKLAGEIFEDNTRLLWYDTDRHELWPGLRNMYGWPEFTQGHFAVHRDTVPDFTPNIFNLLAHINVPQFAFTDSVFPETAPLFYAVLAVDNDGDRSPEPTRMYLVPEFSFPGNDTLIIDTDLSSVQDTVLHIANTGDRPLFISDVTGDASWLSVTAFPEFIAPGMVDSIQVRAVSDNLAAGDHISLLTVQCSDPFLPEQFAVIVLRIPLGARGEIKATERLLISPQPATGKLHLEWQSDMPSTAVDVELLDLNGRSVYRQRTYSDDHGSVEFTIVPPDDIGSGTYIARITSRGARFQRKVILLR